MKRAAKASLVISTGITENGGSSSDNFVADLDKKGDRNSGAKTALSKGFAEARDEIGFKEAAAHLVPVE